MVHQNVFVYLQPSLLARSLVLELQTFEAGRSGQIKISPNTSVLAFSRKEYNLTPFLYTELTHSVIVSFWSKLVWHQLPNQRYQVCFCLFVFLLGWVCFLFLSDVFTVLDLCVILLCIAYRWISNVLMCRCKLYYAVAMVHLYYGLFTMSLVVLTDVFTVCD